MNLTGFPLFLRHLVDLGAVAALLSVCTVVGLEVLSRLRVRYDSPLESLLFGLGLGSGVVSTALLGLGFAGGLHNPGSELTVLACAGLGTRQWKCLPRLIGGALRTVVGEGGRARVAILTLFGFFTAFVLLLALAPSTDWDSLVYHLRVPAQFLERGRIFLPEDNLHVAFVGLVHMLYLPLLGVGSASAPAILSAAMTIVLGLAVFAVASRLWGGGSGTASLLLLWTSPIVLLVGGTARIDLSCALLLLLGQYALILAWRGDEHQLSAAGLLAGFAVATKYHALLYAAMLLPLAVLAGRAGGRTAGEASKRILVAVGLAVLAAVPFLAKNMLLLGAPFYPFFAQARLQPWLVPAFHRATVPAGAAVGAYQALADARQGFNVVDAFLHPGRLTIEPEGRFYFASPAFVLLLLWPVFRRDRGLCALGLPALGYLLILLTVYPHTNLRYLIPALAPLTVVTAVLAVHLSAGVVPRPVRTPVGVLVAGMVLAPSLATASTWLFRAPYVSYAVGRTSADAFLAGHFAPWVAPYWRLARFVNESLPRDSRILDVFEVRGYYMQRAVLVDPQLTNWPLLAETSAPDDCLRSLGITHVLLGRASLEYYLARGVDSSALRVHELQRFAARCLHPVVEAPGLTLYRIATPSRASR